MAFIKRRGDRYIVRWTEYRNIAKEDGTTQRRRITRGETVADEKTAGKLKRQVEEALALTGTWQAAAHAPTVTIKTIGLGYVRAAVDAGAPLGTQRFRSSMVNAFFKFVGENEPATSLSLSLLDAYAASLPAEGRKATTRHRKLLEVELLWAWAFDRPELFPGVPRPRKLTGKGADRISAPNPVVALAAPTWASLDAMIAQLDSRTWYWRLALILRYTGLRVSQACTLRWNDVHLDRGYTVVRAGQVGAKKGRTRALPLHEALVAEMAGWGPRVGFVLARPNGRPRRGDDALVAFRRAWTQAKVNSQEWNGTENSTGEAGDRAHGRPTHAFHAGFINEMRVLRVPEHIALYLTGHSQGHTLAAYIPEGNPESSGYWSQLVEAIGKIPRIGATGQVINLSHRGP